MSYAYNQLGRLQSAQHSLATLNAYDLGITTPITYDANGNITLLERGGSARAYNYRLADSKPNQVASIIVNGNLVATYQYDANGNVSQTDALPALRYDPYLNLTTRIERPSAGNVTFGYGMADERVFKQDYDSQGDLLRSIYYVHGLGSSPLVERKVDEQNSTTSTIYHIYGLNGMLATQASGQWHFMLKDHLGSTRVVTDENDLVAAYYNYSAFGESFLSAESEEFAYRFTGQEYDEETGLHNYKARLYDSELGRFYGIDPVPQYTSPYAYVGNSPVNYVDPDGQFFLPAWVAGAIIGGGLGYANAVINDYDARQTFYSIAGGALLGVGVGLGIDAGILDGVGRVAGNGLAGVDNGIGYAEGVFQGVKPLVDGGLQLLPQGTIEVHRIIQQERLLEGGGNSVSTLRSGPSLAEQFKLTPQNYIPGYEIVSQYGLNPVNWPKSTYNGPVVAGAPPVLPSTFPVGNIINYLRNGTRISGVLRANISNAIKNPTLKNVFNELYRKGASIRSGSTADAIRYTKDTGNLVGNSDHLTKGRDYYRALKNLIQSGRLDANDVKIANQMIKDLKNALNY